MRPLRGRHRRRPAPRPASTRNDRLIGKRDGRERLSTPALVLDLDALQRNLDAMAAYCDAHATTLRPHAKTHKSARIAALQAKAGAAGICTATLREAETMVAARIHGVLITSPMAGEAKLDGVAELLQRDAGLMLVVDSIAGAKALEARLGKARLTAKVLIDIDVGMQRTGVSDLRSAIALARHLDRSDRLQLLGVQCYSGMVQHIGKYASRARTYGAELGFLEAILDKMRSLGLPTTIVSGGGTGTFDIDRRRGLFTECQAGSYVFMDVQYNEVELVEQRPPPFETSLYVQSMVLSSNHPGSATIDAGFKSFAMDGPLPQVHSGAPKGARFQFYGDEFGKLRWEESSKRLALGRKIELITPHCDPTVNLHNVYHCVRGRRLVDIWPVDARGAV